MVAKDELVVGYIRSNVFSKVMPMFKDDVFSLCARRSEQRACDEYDEKEAWVNVSTTTDLDMEVLWDRRMHSKAFSYKDVLSKIDKYNLDDMTVQWVIFSFKSPRIIEILNERIDQDVERKCEALAQMGGEGWKRKVRGLRDSVVELKDSTKLYATFKNHPIHSELKSLRYVYDINKHEIEKLHFKAGVLDIIGLNTERHYRYGEKENIEVKDISITEPILRALDTSKWDVEIEVDGVINRPRPCVNRIYKRDAMEQWVLVSEKEIV